MQTCCTMVLNKLIKYSVTVGEGPPVNLKRIKLVSLRGVYPCGDVLGFYYPKCVFGFVFSVTVASMVVASMVLYLGE